MFSDLVLKKSADFDEIFQRISKNFLNDFKPIYPLIVKNNPRYNLHLYKKRLSIYKDQRNL